MLVVNNMKRKLKMVNIIIEVNPIEYYYYTF